MSGFPTSIAVLLAVVSAGLAAPPELEQQAPLRAVPDEPGAERIRPAAEADAEDDQLFYYNGPQRIYLNDTGRAVARLAPDTPVDGHPLQEAALALEENDPLAELAPALRESRMVIVRTRNAGAFNLQTAEEPPAGVEYVLPIVAEDLQRTDDGGVAPSDPMIMTNAISARFSPNLIGEAREEQQAIVAKYAAPFGLDVVRASGVPNAFTLQLAEGPVTYQRLLAAANELYETGAERGEVLYAKPDFIRVKRRHQQVQDPRFANQWHLQQTGQGGGSEDADIDAPEAWRVTEGGAEVRIAIIDDSVQHEHPDLRDNYQTGRYYDGTTVPPSHTHDPSPTRSSQRHGTPCAGVAVARANQTGVRGAAPRCGLIGVHFWNSTDSQIAEAFYFCDDPDGDPTSDDGAAIVSCSWSLNISPPVDLVIAIDDLALNGRNGRGLVILFAAGNDDGPISPSNQNLARESVICVGATSDQDVRSWYSNYGPELEVVAPSSDRGSSLRIDTTDNTDPTGGVSGYAAGDYTGTGRTGFGGTSSATPLAAGVCGLILSVNPQLSAVQVRAILEHSCDRIRGGALHLAEYNPATSHDVNYGYGRVNAKNAVLAAAASLVDPDGVWPDHVKAVTITQGAGMMKVAWENPRDNVFGVLVVQGAAPIQWRPADGERYLPGDRVGCEESVVLSVDNREAFDAPTASGDHFAVFVFNRDHKYSWGMEGRFP